jgi:hypothetical protein
MLGAIVFSFLAHVWEPGNRRLGKEERRLPTLTYHHIWLAAFGIYFVGVVYVGWRFATIYAF